MVRQGTPHSLPSSQPPCPWILLSFLPRLYSQGRSGEWGAVVAQKLVRLGTTGTNKPIASDSPETNPCGRAQPAGLSPTTWPQLPCQSWGATGTKGRVRPQLSNCTRCQTLSGEDRLSTQVQLTAPEALTDRYRPSAPHPGLCCLLACRAVTLALKTDLELDVSPILPVVWAFICPFLTPEGEKDRPSVSAGMRTGCQPIDSSPAWSRWRLGETQTPCGSAPLQGIPQPGTRPTEAG